MNAPPPHGGSSVYIGTGETQTIDEVTGGGEYIKLVDGSLWEVDETDRVDAELWLGTENVIVVDGHDPLYPYTMINTEEDGEKVHVRLVEH
jgi:hypothetical protein